MSAQSDGQWLVHQSHLVEVGLGEVGTDGALQLFGAEQGVDADGAVKQVVMPCEGGLSTSVLEVGGGGQSTQVPVAVVQLAHGGVGRQVTAVGEKVRAVALGAYLCREVVERVVGHEMVQVQVVYLDVCIVGHQLGGHIAFGIQGDGGVAFQFHAATAFLGCEVSSVSGAVGLDGTVEADAVGYAEVF